MTVYVDDSAIPATAWQPGQASVSSSSGQCIAPSSPPARRRGLPHRAIFPACTAQGATAPRRRTTT